MTDKQPLSVEELLKPRIKVISPWPDMQGSDVGDVIHLPNEDWVYSDGTFCQPDYFAIWPHLFSPLPWYAERTAEQIKAVKYVKDRGNRVYELLDWSIEGDVINALISSAPYVVHVPHLFPATETEYTAYINKQK